MNKKLGILLITAFLSVQIFSLLHLAELDFEQHSHSDKVCSICLSSELSDSLSVAFAVSLPLQNFEDIILPSLQTEFFEQKITFDNAPRAPPIFCFAS